MKLFQASLLALAYLASAQDQGKSYHGKQNALFPASQLIINDERFFGSENAAKISTLNVSNSCPICQNDFGDLRICSYDEHIKAQFSKETEDSENIVLAVHGKIATAERLAQNPYRFHLNFLISNKCLDACPQLHHKDGFVLMVKAEAFKMDNQLIVLDDNVAVLPMDIVDRLPGINKTRKTEH